MAILGLPPDDELWTSSSAAIKEQAYDDPTTLPLNYLAPLVRYHESISNNETKQHLNREQLTKYQQEMNKKLVEDIERKVENDIEVARRSFQSTLEIQAKGLKRILQLEQERLQKEQEAKKLQEEQRRKLEEEKKRKQQEEIRRLKELEAKKKLEEERKRKEEEELKRKEESRLAEEAKKGKGLTNFALIRDKFMKYKTDISDIKSQVVEPLKKESASKRKEINALKRKINVKLGQLSNSLKHLMQLGSEVVELIKFAQTNADELTYKWILNFTAKAVVSQAETEVSIKPNAGLPLGRLCLMILKEFPEFQYFLEARLVKKCPYIIGFTCSINTEEGRMRMGWKRNDGRWEDEGKYDERVSGICTLWAVMTRLSVENEAALADTSIFDLKSSWSFAARICNTELDLITSAHLQCLCNWWEACAMIIVQTYKNQGNKLLEAVGVQLPAVLSDKKYGSAARLYLMYETYQKEGSLGGLKEMDA